MIPLFEVNGHELVSLNGKKSSFYQIIPSDIEGMTDFSQKEIFSELERNLVDYEEKYLHSHLANNYMNHQYLR